MSDTTDTGRPAPGINRLFGPDALSNIFSAIGARLGNATDAPYVAGPGDPAAGTGVVDTTETASSVRLEEPAAVPALIVRHIVETIERGSSDFRIFRVQVGPWAQAAPSTATASPTPTTVVDANPTRTKVKIRNVSAAATSIFIVRAGTGGGGAYLNVGYRLQQNGETIEIDTTAPIEAYCTLNTDVGTLQVIEEFSATDDTGQLATPE